MTTAYRAAPIRLRKTANKPCVTSDTTATTHSILTIHVAQAAPSERPGTCGLARSANARKWACVRNDAYTGTIEVGACHTGLIVGARRSRVRSAHVAPNHHPQ